MVFFLKNIYTTLGYSQFQILGEVMFEGSIFKFTIFKYELWLTQLGT